MTVTVTLTVCEEISWLSMQGTIWDSDFAGMTVGEEKR